MEIFVIRHGQSIGNTKKGFIAGRKDPDGLTPIGKSQITRTAWELRNKGIMQIMTSPVVRAQESAKILSHLLEAPVKKADFLYELDQGIFENHYWWEVLPKDFKPDKKTDPRYNFDIKYQDGESFKMLTDRVFEGLQTLKNFSDQQKLILITHDAVVSTITYLIENRIDLSKQQIDGKHYIDYIHKNRVPNGSFVKIILKDNLFHVVKRWMLDTHVGVNKSSVAFYVTGLFNLNKPVKTTSFKTASGHKVYLIKNNKSYLTKLLTQREAKTDSHLLDLYKYLAKNTQIPAPRIEYLDDYHIFFNKCLLTLDYTEGETMELCLKMHPERLKVVQSELYRTIKQIHTIPVTDVKKFWYTTSTKETTLAHWKSFITQAINNSLEILSDISIDEGVKSQIKQELLSLKKYVSGTSYSVVPIHGDLSSENIVISHTKNTCRLAKILDFERTRIGDPLWDLVYYYGWIERINEKVAADWKKVFWKNLSLEQQQRFLQFRVLFHLWTVRDMYDYKGNRIRKQRGLKSLEILQEL